MSDESLEAETLSFLRKLVRRGWSAMASDESLMCYYCGCCAEYSKPKHKADCLYLRAKDLLDGHAAAARDSAGRSHA